MELPLEKQLVVIKLAKRHYITIINNLKLDYKYNSFRFLEKTIDIKMNISIGMCICIERALVTTKDFDININIENYIPIFDKHIIYEEANKFNYKIKKPDLTTGYWYPVEEYRNRINVFNFMIKYLQLKIKENGKNLCNA